VNVYTQRPQCVVMATLGLEWNIIFSLQRSISLSVLYVILNRLHTQCFLSLFPVVNSRKVHTVHITVLCLY